MAVLFLLWRMDTMEADIVAVLTTPELTVPTIIKYIRKHPIVNTIAKNIVLPIKTENAIKADTTIKSFVLSFIVSNMAYRTTQIPCGKLYGLT